MTAYNRPGDTGKDLHVAKEKAEAYFAVVAVVFKEAIDRQLLALSPKSKISEIKITENTGPVVTLRLAGHGLSKLCDQLEAHINEREQSPVCIRGRAGSAYNITAGGIDQIQALWNRAFPNNIIREILKPEPVQLMMISAIYGQLRDHNLSLKELSNNEMEKRFPILFFKDNKYGPDFVCVEIQAGDNNIQDIRAIISKMDGSGLRREIAGFKTNNIGFRTGLITADFLLGEHGARLQLIGSKLEKVISQWNKDFPKNKIDLDKIEKPKPAGNNIVTNAGARKRNNGWPHK